MSLHDWPDRLNTPSHGQALEFQAEFELALQQAKRGGKARRVLWEQIVHWIADTRNLKIAWDHLAHYGGQVAGPDGLTYSDHFRGSCWEDLRKLSRTILTGTYRHGPVREERHPKRSGHGFRTIHVANILDRVVARAATQILRPMLDPGLGDLMFCRPGRGPWHALAHARSLAVAQDRWVWLSDDITNAFDQVPRDRLFQALRQRLPSDELIEFLRRLLDNGQRKGLRQGSAISSFLMLFYLEHFVNKGWCRSHPCVPLIWYVDDMLLLAGRQDNAADLYAQLRKMLSDAGMPLKGNCETALHDLDQGKRVQWLGFRIGLQAKDLGIEIPFAGSGNLLERLHSKLCCHHDQHDATTRANATIMGLLKHAGPAFPFMDHKSFCQQIAAAAREAAFEEIPGQADLIAQWEHGYRKWIRIRDESADIVSQRALQAHDDDESPEDEANLDAAPF